MRRVLKVQKAISSVLVMLLVITSFSPVIAQEASPEVMAPNVEITIRAADDTSNVVGTEIELRWSDDVGQQTETRTWTGVPIQMYMLPGTTLFWELRPLESSNLMTSSGRVDIVEGMNTLNLTIDLAPVVESEPTATVPSGEHGVVGTPESELQETVEASPATDSGPRLRTANEPQAIESEAVAADAVASGTVIFNPILPPDAELAPGTELWICAFFPGLPRECATWEGEPVSMTMPAGQIQWSAHVVDISDPYFQPIVGTVEVPADDTVTVDIPLEEMVASRSYRIRVVTWDGAPVPEGTQLCADSGGQENCVTYVEANGSMELIGWGDPGGVESTAYAIPPVDSNYSSSYPVLVAASNGPALNIMTLPPRELESGQLNITIRNADGGPLNTDVSWLTFNAQELYYHPAELSDDNYPQEMSSREGTIVDDVWSGSIALTPGTWAWIGPDGLARGVVDIVPGSGNSLEIVLDTDAMRTDINFEVTFTNGGAEPGLFYACVDTGSEWPNCEQIMFDADFRIGRATIPGVGPGPVRTFISNTNGIPHSAYPGTERVWELDGRMPSVTIQETIDLGKVVNGYDSVSLSTVPQEVTSGSTVSITLQGDFYGTEILMQGALPPGFTVTSVTCSDNFVSYLDPCASIVDGGIVVQGERLPESSRQVSVTVTGTIDGEVGSVHPAGVCGASDAVRFIQLGGGNETSVVSANVVRVPALGLSGFASIGSSESAPVVVFQGGTTTLGGAAIALIFLGGLIFVIFPTLDTQFCAYSEFTIIAQVTPEPTATLDPTATIMPTGTVEPTGTVAPTPTDEPTGTSEPMQTSTVTETPGPTYPPTMTQVDDATETPVPQVTSLPTTGSGSAFMPGVIAACALAAVSLLTWGGLRSMAVQRRR